MADAEKHIATQGNAMADLPDGAVLSKDNIIKCIKAGEIVVEPYDPDNVSCASIDLTLSNEFRYYVPGRSLVDIKEETSYKDFTEKITISEDKPFILGPGQACLAITKESIQLSPRLCGLLEGRSRFARLGLFVHITASFMNPGIKNRQVLEIYNSSSNTVALYPGVKICQFVFLRMCGSSLYSGKFAAQIGDNW